jgi:hypothetical protein
MTNMVLLLYREADYPEAKFRETIPSLGHQIHAQTQKISRTAQTKTANI